MPAKRKITTEATYEDIKTEPSLRPGRLEEYIGQEKTKENLRVYELHYTLDRNGEHTKLYAEVKR